MMSDPDVSCLPRSSNTSSLLHLFSVIYTHFCHGCVPHITPLYYHNLLPSS